MMRTIFILLAANLCTMSFAQSTVNQLVQDAMKKGMDARAQIIETAKRGIVRIEAQERQNGPEQFGTGFVISSSEDEIRILTANHVVDGSKSVHVFFYPDTKVAAPAEILPFHSKELDLAVLAVKAEGNAHAPRSITPFHFVSGNTLQVAQRVWTVNENWVPIPNTITMVADDDDPNLFQYSAGLVGEGFSGGPVFDEYLNIVGMHLKSGNGASYLDVVKGHVPTRNGNGYAYALKMDAAFQFLARLKCPVPKLESLSMPLFGAPAPAPAAPMRFSQLLATGTYQMEGTSGPLLLVVTSNASDSSYTARLTGGFLLTFVGGVKDQDGLTFSFNNLQAGSQVVVLNGNPLPVPGASLKVTLDRSGQATGRLTGMINILVTTGGALPHRRAGTKTEGEGAPATTVTGQISATYRITEAAQQSLPMPPAAESPAAAATNTITSARTQDRSNISSPVELCAGGCRTRIGDLKMTAQYEYPHWTYPSLKCDERVFQLPANWPSKPYLHSIVCRGPNPRGAEVTLINFRLSETDRMKDQDVVILYSDAVGIGSFLGTDHQLWRVKVYGTSSIEDMSIEMSRR